MSWNLFSLKNQRGTGLISEQGLALLRPQPVLSYLYSVPKCWSKLCHSTGSQPVVRDAFVFTL